jgi:DNA-binding transcriptional LysR family regulator
MHMSLRQLELFASVARNESFSRAAEEMHLTQPAVSVQIKHLEDGVGVPLFEYIGRKFFLTEAGRELYAVTSTVFESLERFEMMVSDIQGLKQGKLKLAVTTTAKYFIPRILGAFCERYPGVDASLKVTNREGVIARIEENADDLYVMGQPPEELNVKATPFMENELVVIARREHPLVGKKRVSLARLMDEPFLMREPTSGTRMALERLLAERGVHARTRMELGSNEAIKQGVLGGLGVAVLSRHSLALDASDSDIAVLDVAHFPIRRHWYAVYPAEKRLSVVANTFLDFLLSHEGEARGKKAE